MIAKRNPDALWISGYEDRIIYDARRGDNEKYGGLVALLTNSFGMDFFKKVIIDYKGRGHEMEPEDETADKDETLAA